MRVLFILHRLDPQGQDRTATIVLKLATMAQHAGHAVHLLAALNGQAPRNAMPSAGLPSAVESVREGVPVTLVPGIQSAVSPEDRLASDNQMVMRLGSWMQRQEFDLVHVLDPMPMSAAVQAVQRCGVPYVVSLTDFSPLCLRNSMIDATGGLCPGPQGGDRCGERCPDSSWPAESLQRRFVRARELLAAAGALVCPSAYMVQRYQDAFPELTVCVIPHGLDLVFLAPPVGAAEPAAETTGLTLGCIGGIESGQGLVTLLQALAAVPDPHLRLHILGASPGEPALPAEVHQLIAADPRVRLIGEVSPENVARHLRAVDLFCLPSLEPAGFSLALAQAAAAGVPALVSDLGAAGALVTEFGCGQVVPAGDRGAWARAIAEVVGQPQQLAAWRANLPLPLRIEEEAFLYDNLYRSLLQPA